MTRNPLSCAPEEHAGTAAWRMWEGDCGFLPVVRGERLVGVITDRDIAMAVALRGTRAQDLRVGEVRPEANGVIVCGPEEPVGEALTRMRQHRVHRLPVVEDGRLVGVVSINDLVLAAGPTAGRAGRPTFRDVVVALQGVCAHRCDPEASAAA